jgi:hypothetical protein
MNSAGFEPDNTGVFTHVTLPIGNNRSRQGQYTLLKIVDNADFEA